MIVVALMFSKLQDSNLLIGGDFHYLHVAGILLPAISCHN
nr:MAG TPA: hypothetical protein [Caudoviricetes sp.]DAR60037.1 MAG TPA: hypothetical protein [Caudoviricetes sp.]